MQLALIFLTYVHSSHIRHSKVVLAPVALLAIEYGSKIICLSLSLLFQPLNLSLSLTAVKNKII